MNRSKEIIWTSLTILLFVILYATNPKEYQLKAHIKNSLKQEAISEGGLGGAFKEIFAGPESWLMSLTTEKQDLYFFSVYTVDGLEQKHKYLGILGTFVELPSK